VVSGPLVCLLAAGRGTRMRFAGGALHKALAPLGNRAVLSHVIESFPADARFVVAVGHLADQIEAYLALVHEDRDITLVEVEHYDGPGAGPGLSLLTCAADLVEPFALVAADSIVSAAPALAGPSWMGVAPVPDPLSYMTLDTSADGLVTGFQERTGPSNLAFVGLAWIAEPGLYLDAVRAAASDGELQVTPGFEGLVRAGAPVRAVRCEWIDTGTTASYDAARVRFAEEPHGGRMPSDVTYLFGDRVVKWFRDPAGADRRAARARDLGDAVPPLRPAPSGWLAYERAEGETLRDRLDAPGTTALLNWAGTHLWDDRAGGEAFTAACRRFYGDKTIGRLGDYLAAREGAEPPSGLSINGLATSTVAEAVARDLERVVGAAVPSGFHGDLHEGNIVQGPGGLALIDWRDDFGGLQDRGDRCYDLAKLLHTLELPESVMSSDTFGVEPAGPEGLALGHPDTALRRDARAALWSWCAARGLDWRAIGTVDALVFVNMAPLYDRALGDFLYFLGRWLLEVTHRAASVTERETAFSGTRASAARGT
jgi:dTDP-glucose pyrophosphorylase